MHEVLLYFIGGIARPSGRLITLMQESLLRNQVPGRSRRTAQ